MLKLLFELIFFTGLALASPQILPNENQITAKQEEIDLDGDDLYEYVQPNKLELEISNMPDSVFVYEIFSMDIIADTKQNLNLDLNLSIDLENLIWLNPEPNWNEIKSGIYQTTLWFEASNTNANIKNINLVLNRNGNFFQQDDISVDLPLVKDLEFDEYFSSLVADDLSINMFKSSKFDNENNLIIFELEGKNANLNSFFVPGNFQKQELRSIKGELPNQSGMYFIIADKNISNIKFNYYNRLESAFIDYEFEVKIEKDELSTQVDLNPQESEFEMYKDIVIYFFIALFLLIFIFSFNYYALIIAILFGAYSFYDNKPFSDGLLKKDVKVQILPSQNSTVFYISSKDQKVKLMATYADYTKILLENKKIGWVKSEDIR